MTGVSPEAAAVAGRLAQGWRILSHDGGPACPPGEGLSPSPRGPLRHVDQLPPKQVVWETARKTQESL